MNSKFTLIAAGALTLSTLLSGCGSSAASSDTQSLTASFYMTPDSAQYAAMQSLVSDFTEATGIQVDVSIDTTNYENNLKVQMASNNLPDVFATHGWSVMRYSDFLEPLSDEPWAQYVNPSLDATMKDAEGSLYALPIEYTVTGVNVNLDVLEEAGIDPIAIATWDDFDAAAAAIKGQGITPIVASGKTSSPGNLANFIASGAFTEEQNQSFADGTFDTALWTSGVLDHVDAWAKAGYFNPDYVSATLDDMASQIAQGQAAFAFAQPTLLTSALKLNADANVGFIPLPSTTGDRYLVGGEGVNAYGISRASNNKDAARQFLNYLAEPENAAKLAVSIGTYSGLTNVDANLGEIQDSFEAWVTPGELPTKPFFDRAYLPNGMWATVIASTDSVITQQADPGTAAGQMATEFKTLYGQQG